MKKNKWKVFNGIGYKPGDGIMDVKYEFGDRTVSEVNTIGAVAAAFADFMNDDENRARNERRHNEISIEALNEALNEELDDITWEPIDSGQDVEAAVLVTEEKETLFAALERLPEKQQRLVRLYYYEGKTIEEIGQLLSVSHQAVSKQLVAIKSALKKYFEQF